MRKFLTLIIGLLFYSIAIGQTIDSPITKEKMRKDFEVFKEISWKANSGLYKYRTVAEIDSIYHWAAGKIEQSSTYLDFYNIIQTISDFEGSCHNSVKFSDKSWELVRKETTGYFPYPIIWVDHKWRINFAEGTIPLGAEVVSINEFPIAEIMESLFKYDSTDGFNKTGKRVGIRTHFSRYFRLNYGLKDTFNVTYKIADSNNIKTKSIKSTGYLEYYRNFHKRHSKVLDGNYYKNLKADEKYSFEKMDNTTGILRLSDFEIGRNAEDPEHLEFCKYLDSLFSEIKKQDFKNLIVDIRYNSGGTDPNELVPYKYLSKRNFSENKNAWVSFQKVPFLKYMDHKAPRFLRSLGVWILGFNKYYRKQFPIEKDGKFYQGPSSKDHKIWTPDEDAFLGNVYLLVNPEIASAGSNFGSLLASNDNVTIIGEETVGGFYGHNGHIPYTYILPKSKIKFKFSVVNLEQYIIEKPNQIFGQGIIPDHVVNQTYKEFIGNEDVILNYTLELIKQK